MQQNRLQEDAKKKWGLIKVGEKNDGKGVKMEENLEGENKWRRRKKQR